MTDRTELRRLLDADRTELRRLAEAATPGPWFWWGNTDNHSVALCGRQPGLGVCEVISTLSVERSTTGREANRLRQDLAEYTDLSLSGIEDAVEEWATDEYGQPRTDQRLSVTDENYIRRTAEELAVYEVARAQGLPDDTPRDHERVYRADVCDLRATNARYLAAASPATVLALLDQLDAAEAAANDAILYWKDTRDALARQTPHYLAVKAGVERVRELHARESFWQYSRDQEHSYQTQQEAADESGCDCPEVAGSLAGYAHTPECLATITHFDVCTECARIEYADSDRQSHGEFSGYAESLWPCPTIAAIGGGDRG